MRAWLLAIAVALIGVVALESAGLVQADSAFPPYRAGQFLWAEHLLGGVLFGIGMTLASGCGNKCLIRIGGGNLNVGAFPTDWRLPPEARPSWENWIPSIAAMAWSSIGLREHIALLLDRRRET